MLVTFVVGACTTTTPTAQSPGKPAWTNCSDGFQCAALPVPLDYTHPDGRKISLALIKKPATGPGTRIGSLLYNPGGPGESGLYYLRSDPSVKGLNRRFDLVAWDPRGVGGSTPITCVDTAQLEQFLSIDSVLDDPEEKAAGIQSDKDFVAGCQRRSGDLLPFMDSASTARDMDQIRAAVGDNKLTYLGFSYGTLLGEWYARLFPNHIRALSLDGVLDPTVPANDSSLGQVVGFEQNLQAFLADCRARITTCAYGRSGDPSAKLTSLMARLDATPLKVGNREVTRSVAMTGVLQALYDRSLWPYLDTGLSALQNGDGRVILFLADFYNKRNPDGTYQNLFNGAYLSVYCLDFPVPTDIAAYDALGPTFAKASPLFGPWSQYGNLPCAYWPVRARNASPLPIRGVPAILLVGGTNDPATPYSDAQSVNRQIDGSVLLTRSGEGHTSYGSSGCSHAAEDSYLIDLTLPATGTVCSS